MVWLFHDGVAIYENGVAISISVSRAPCRSQKAYADRRPNRVNWNFVGSGWPCSLNALSSNRSEKLRRAPGSDECQSKEACCSKML